MEAASSKQRPGKMSQKVSCSLTATQRQRNCAATFHPVSSMHFTILRRAASRRACQVGAPRRATRSTARAMRSEERRVGKERRSRGASYNDKIDTEEVDRSECAERAPDSERSYDTVARGAHALHGPAG